MSNIKHPELADEGKRRIEWAELHMPVLRSIGKYFGKKKPLKGLRVGMCLHVEPKTCVLALTLKKAGAEVAIAGCNPLSTQDGAASALSKMGVEVFAWNGQTEAEYFANIHSVLDIQPNVLIDDGADMIITLHKDRPELISGILGGCEETTTGVIRLKAMEKEGALAFPVIAVNDALTKHMFDNRYGTGQSTVDGILRATNLSIAGKTVVVAGYGWCGRGIAMRMKGMGADVIITEVEPVRALEARMDGYRVMKMIEAVPQADMLITATGNKWIIGKAELDSIKNGCILANAGHFNVEVDTTALEEASGRHYSARELVEAYELKSGKTVFLLAEGRLVNLAAGQGHPAEIMDMSFALQAMSAEYIVKEKKQLKPKVYPVPDALDRSIAQLKLKAMGIEIDQMTDAQRKYAQSWILE